MKIKCSLLTSISNVKRVWRENLAWHVRRDPYIGKSPTTPYLESLTPIFLFTTQLSWGNGED